LAYPSCSTSPLGRLTLSGSNRSLKHPMKKLLVPCIVAAFGSAISYAAPADDVTAAAKKLADAPNYSWSQTIANAGGGGGGGFGGGPTAGRTEKGGVTLDRKS